MTKTIGRFEVIRLLGRGGMAEVYLADDSNLDRQVAIKLLPQHFLHDPQFKARFEREARVLAKLDHPSVAPIYDFGYYQDQPYMVSRFMSGGSLESRLKAKGKLSVAEALAILEPVCAALDAAHEKGIVHRDLKPGNILFDDKGRVFVADFGIAKLVEGSTALTGTAIVGTPAYMSPEQFAGEGELDGRSDQYSLGVMLFEMLSGQLPFKATSTARMMQMHLMEPPPSIRKLRKDVPEVIAAAIEQALSKKPAARHASMGALLTMVQQAVHSKIIADPLPGSFTKKKVAPAKPTKLIEARRPIEDHSAIAGEGDEALPSASFAQASSKPMVYGGIAIAFALLVWALARVQSPPSAVETTATAISTNTTEATPEPTLAPTPLSISIGELTSLKSIRPNVLSVAFSPGGEFLATGEGNIGPDGDDGKGGTVNVYRTTDWASVVVFIEEGEDVFSVDFSPDGQLLAYGGWNGRELGYRIRVRRTDDWSSVKTLTGSGYYVNDLSFSSDGQWLAASRIDGAIQLWNTSSWELAQTWSAGSVAFSVVFSPDGQLLVSSGENNTIQVWRISDGGLLQTITGSAMAFSPDGSMLAVSDPDEGIHLWSVLEGSLVQGPSAFPDDLAPGGPAFSRDGQLFTNGDTLWRTSDWQILKDDVNCCDETGGLAFSPTGQLLAIGHLFDGIVQIWQIAYTDE